MNGGNDNVEPCERIIGQIEPAVRPDVDLGPLQDPEPGKLLIRLVNQLDLFSKPLFIQSTRDAEALGVVRDRDVGVSFFLRRLNEGAEVMTAVGPVRMDVKVALNVVERNEVREFSRQRRLDLAQCLP